MKHSLSTESYIEGVVEFHQYKDALGLTAPEARKHADTLEVFEELTENVATNDELRLMYTGVLRSRGQNRLNAMAAVREVEGEITAYLHDVEVIGDTAYRNTLSKLNDDTEIKKRAERFIQLFKPVFSASELPKPKKRRVTKRITEDTQLTPIEQEDQTAAIVSITKVPAQPKPFIPYYDRERIQSAQAAQLARTEIANKRAYIREQGVIQRFKNHLLSSIIEMEKVDENGIPGIIWTELSRSIAANLGIEIDEAKQAVRNLIRSGDLTVVGHVNGIRRLSGQHDETEDPIHDTRDATIATRERETKIEPIFAAEELAQAKRILEILGRDKHIERGVKIKSLWLDDGENEELIRETISKLIKYGDRMVMRNIPKRQNAPHSRRNTEPYIRFTDHVAFRRYKEDPELVVKSLQTLLSE